MTMESRISQIETLLRRRWPDLVFSRRVAGNHTTLIGPSGFFPSEIDVGPKGGMTINDFRSFPSTMRDGSSGNLSALETRARWDRAS
jgi:hypothetical protein